MYHMPSWSQRIAPAFNFQGVLGDFEPPLPDYHIEILIQGQITGLYRAVNGLAYVHLETIPSNFDSYPYEHPYRVNSEVRLTVALVRRKRTLSCYHSGWTHAAAGWRSDVVPCKMIKRA
jgi:hypothetical protein